MTSPRPLDLLKRIRRLERQVRTLTGKRHPASQEDIDIARELYADEDGNIRIPDDATITHDDQGCWVEARVWVGNCDL